MQPQPPVLFVRRNRAFWVEPAWNGLAAATLQAFNGGWHEKGFGTRAEGDATVENYVAGGDVVTFVLSPSAFQDASSERLFYLSQPQRVTIDGKILIPYVGPVEVLGLTESWVGRLRG